MSDLTEAINESAGQGIKCSVCKGAGKCSSGKCGACDGKGYLSSPEKSARVTHTK